VRRCRRRPCANQQKETHAPQHRGLLDIELLADNELQNVVDGGRSGWAVRIDRGRNGPHRMDATNKSPETGSASSQALYLAQAPPVAAADLSP
jgi:hypothetical protein